ncbi:2Fe-2S iron-sulfur cluster-binding protein [Govanella unica]|uniref:2Fe-2S iron-sulfur cluster-binding protein n=1 Tax=Govanella unica TaxID=2975056 RepID=A0A9X3TZ84_9PROT|nr:2Fe-2S iron-sulfur cluster-binding protein [Govania unica]MDA5194501.1 2Fe-2S iron-sulfur cluster-binding protein [Govania unica]
MAKLIVTNRDGETSTIEADTGISLMENLRDNDFELAAICGGMCSCATCHVFIDEDWMAKVGPRSEDENDLLGELDSFNDASSRLSCQIEVTKELDGLMVTIAPDE